MVKTAQSALPDAGEGKRGEDGYIGYLLRQAAAASRLRLDRAFTDLGITHPQFVVMTMLKAYPGQSNAEIARIALLTPQTTNVIIVNLERAGHIERRRHDTHGRILQVQLTPSGEELLRECGARVRAIEKALVRGFTDDEVKTIRRWLAGIARPDEGASDHPSG